MQNDPIANRAVSPRQTLAHGTVERDGQDFAEVAYPINGSVVLLSAPLHDQLRTVAVVRRRVLIAGGVAFGFALLLGYAGAVRLARRIRRLEEAAERIAEGNFTEPVVDASTDELGQLARTFERMRLRLSQLDRARGEFIANASHELRTPLFSLGGFLELLDDEGLDEATRDEFLAQMRQQVDRLGAAGDRPARPLAARRGPARGRPRADRSVRAGRGRGRASSHRGRSRTDHTLESSASEAVFASGDEARVLQIGRILVENALLHTPAGSRVRITTAQDGGRAMLTVADDGPGIPRDARRQVFERFYRLDGTRASGSGLGLAIARELADLMGGTARARRRGRLDAVQAGPECGGRRPRARAGLSRRMPARPFRRENAAPKRRR